MLTDLQKAQEEGIAPWKDVYVDTRDYTVFVDGFPVTEGHLLFVPKTYDLETVLKCYKVAHQMGNDNVKSQQWDGYNIGMNMGEAAGQTVMYPHIHLILRREGDLGRFENGTPYDPAGGVRNVIPGKGNYKKNEMA